MDFHRTIFLFIALELRAWTYGVTCPKSFTACGCVEQKEHGPEGAETIEINCSGRNLTNVPDWQALRSLPVTWIDLSNNYIKEIPNDAFSGVSFATPVPDIWIPRLDINRNPLHSISGQAFRGMRADGLLLHIKHSKIKYFPSEALRNIDNLTDLFFMSSHIKDITTDSFLGFKHLRRLDLSGNKLDFLRSGTFNGLELLLKSLYMNKMGLTEFPTRALQKLQVLWELKLDWNKIKFLPDNMFLPFEATSERFVLSLKHNGLTTISPKAFRRSKIRLYETYLNHNNISDLTFLEDPCSLTFCTYVHISLDHNPVMCKCDLYSILLAGFYDLHGQCKGPEKFVGIPWISKDYDVLAGRDCSSSEVRRWNLPCMGILAFSSCSLLSTQSYLFTLFHLPFVLLFARS